MEAEDASAAFSHLPYDLAEAPAFVREVLLPGGPHARPSITADATRFALEVRDSAIHRYGVFAAERIPVAQQVIEYTGERISYAEASRRSVRPYLYLFWLTPGLLIDGAVGGSGAEYINHSCEPNLEAKVADGHIHFVSLREIAPGEELSLDYKVRGGAPGMRCHCGAPSCRGFINEP